MKQKEIGKAIFFNLKQKELARFELTGWTELVASIINDEWLDLRIWVDSPCYKGWMTRQGLRFRMLDGHWEEFKKLIQAVAEEMDNSLWLGNTDGLGDKVFSSVCSS